MKNVDEFWAEVITKGVHGNSDRYTQKAISIAKSLNFDFMYVKIKS